LFATVVSKLGSSGCAKGARVVVEKPFGRDRASAASLNHTLLSVFHESSIFRIDHYLGKEPVQNLLYWRFANSMFEPIWNRNYINSVQITMAETFGVKGRGPLYEESGAIRDVVQNHILQTVACLAMEAPGSGDPGALRHARTHLLEAIDPIKRADVVYGQFRGYKKEKGVSPRSNVETFVALKLMISSWRWSGVPFFVRAGKCLPVTCTEVLVRLRPPPVPVFDAAADVLGGSNCLLFRLGPDVGTVIDVRSKKAGEKMVGESIKLVAQSEVAIEMTPYERLLGDAMDGDSTLFGSESAVEACWRVVDPILAPRSKVNVYERGSWGPKKAEAITAKNGGWHNPVEIGKKGTKPA
jgi:glucose-6-phosphate 1-dehydrogenase